MERLGSTRTLDVVVLGGGPAGMSAALIAGRARLDAVIVNEEAPRNAVTKASHGFLTRDGAHPSDLLEVAKEQMGKYPSVRYVHGRAETVRRHEVGFVVGLDDGERLRASRVVIATGYADDIERLNLLGIEAVYGRSVFPCPFCDGFEHRDQRLAVFGSERMEHFAPLLRIWSEDLVVFTNGARMTPEIVEALEGGGIRVIQEPVAMLHSRDGNLVSVELESGASVERDAGFIGEEYSAPSATFLEDLGVGTTTNPWGMEIAEVDDSGCTNIAGVYAIGDAHTGFGGLINAASQGYTCMAHIVHEIATERWSA